MHTPEWTNFNQSDPGVTLVQLFAFLTENLLYRANLIPERNRIKFLQLLQVPLQPATAARGLVTINNERGITATVTLPHDLEVLSGNVSFRTERGLDVLPLETRVFFKRKMSPTPPDLVEYYRLLYASYQQPMPIEPSLYSTVSFDSKIDGQVDLNTDTVDRSLWVALLARKNDRPEESGTDPWKTVRDSLGGRTLTLGLATSLGADQTRLVPGGLASATDLLVFEIPRISGDRIEKVPRDNFGRPVPSYRQLEARTDVDLLNMPGVVQLTLPESSLLGVWQDLEPLETGVGDLPPTLEDSTLTGRLITWLRVRASGAALARILWVGINAAPITQKERIISERLADGNGAPDQIRRLSRAPVLKDSITVVAQTGSEQAQWTEIDDLMAAQPEVPVNDQRNAPLGATNNPVIEIGKQKRDQLDVFQADYESGTLIFGDGFHGRRLPQNASVFATYEFCQGAVGNVAPQTINNSPQLPSGFTVSNPIQTWGGADAESVNDGEKQIKRYLQHRDRLVSVMDFESIAWRTPGIDIGRIEVLPAFHPDFVPNEPGSVPGVVTVMAIPRFDPGQPDAPRADKFFLNNLCRYLEPRRLVTTELVVCGPVYKSIWISIGIEVASGFSIAEVVDDVKQNIRRFLAPTPSDQNLIGFAAQSRPLFNATSNTETKGWPLRMAVSTRVLSAVTARVSGVTSVSEEVLLAESMGSSKQIVEMNGLELPRVLGISVVAGEPISIADLRGDANTSGSGVSTDTGSTPPSLLPVPIIPESC
ncbi:MAG: baseplate J/gp47 family protein [Methylobacter sp.]